MTGSRVRQLLCAVALAALVVPAGAQWTSDKPPVLGPDDYPPEATQDPPDRPAQKSDGTNAPNDATGVPQALQDQPAAPGRTDVTVLPAPGAPAAHPAPIEVGALGTPEGPPVGTLDASNGGLSDHLWSGSERAKVEELLSRAPLVSADPVLRDLTRRIVLTRASAPPGQAKKAFTTLRIEKLLDAGLIEEAGAIAAQASPIANDEDFGRVQANAILIANRAQDACGPATATRSTAGDMFWMQLRAYCAAVAGDTATAELTKQVLKAQGRTDPAYDTLVEGVLAHKPIPAGAIANPTAMHIFLLQQAGLPIPEAIARKMGTAENLLVMRDTRNSPRARFEAAERIITTGAAKVSELKQIADAQDLPLGRVASAAADAPGLPFFMGQVLLRRAATIEPRSDEKARLVAQALSLGDKFGQAPLAAALQADVIASIKPSPTNHQYGRVFARALLLANRADLATRWTTNDALMRTIAVLISQDAARMVAAQIDLSTFAAGLAKNPPDPDPDRSYKALVIGLADTLGLAMPADAKAAAVSIESQMWDGQRPGPGQMRTIHEVALAPDRGGEALLLVLNSIQTIGLHDLAPDVTMEFVRLLQGMNETQTARALALDVLAQYTSPLTAPSQSASAQ